MARRLMLVLASTVLALSAVPSSADHLEDPSPPDPRNRVNAWTPQPAGTTSTIVLQYGPYVVHPGSDLTRVDVEIAALDGFVIAARPAVRLADGTEPSDDVVHIHHAHWIKPDPNAPGYNTWFFGTGEEKTRGGGEPYMQADPRYYSEGLRYGIEVRRGQAMGFVSMLHNKSAQPLVLWIEGRFEFVHGTRAQIKQAKNLDYHPLTPVLHGRTFQVPHTGGVFTYPRDIAIGGGDVVPGVGHVWESPYDGTIVIGAGHLHPGGKEVVVSNLGSPSSPCGDAWLDDPDGDGYAGKTIQRIQAYYRDGVFPSEAFQMGITKLGWRAKIRKGDRIAINGTYDATTYAFPDAMSFFGFYVDQEQPPAAGEECSAALVDDPDATHDDIVMSIPNRPWGAEEPDFCDPCDDLQKPLPPVGQHVNTIQVAGFSYVPGDIGTVDATGAPWVNRGETITVVNEDWAAGLVRHSLTSCRSPCNGTYHANYPFHDGVFDSGAIGFTPVDTYDVATDEPVWQLDTTDLEPGHYAYYCRLHPWMKGSFYVK